MLNGSTHRAHRTNQKGKYWWKILFYYLSQNNFPSAALMWAAQNCTQNWNCLKNEGDMGVCTDRQHGLGQTLCIFEC